VPNAAKIAWALAPEVSFSGPLFKLGLFSAARLAPEECYPIPSPTPFPTGSDTLPGRAALCIHQACKRPRALRPWHQEGFLDVEWTMWISVLPAYSDEPLVIVTTTDSC